MARRSVYVLEAAVRRRSAGPGDGPAPSRLGAYVCVLALYLAFAGVLLGFGYGLWPALAGASAACVVAGEVSRRVVTAGMAPVPGPGDASVQVPGVAELLADLARVLDRAGPGPGPGQPGGGRRGG
jgi:hypothetical protein